ncbi:MAG: glycosyltransferase family 4 protein [Porphyromonadaceae bacterium]|nr:glycosyltransferase family 4 protein [Porphyromonadaceae bacterium]
MMIDIMNRQALTQDVSLIIINKENNPELLKTIDNHIRTYIIGRKNHSRNPMPLIQLNRLLRRLHPDVVHIHNRHIMPCLFCKIPHCCYVYTAHTTTTIPQIRRFDKIFAISQYVRRDIEQRYGGRTPVQVIYNGIDTQSIIGKKALSLENNRFRIVQIGRLVHQQKGQDILLEALSILIHTYGHTQVSLDFIGGGPSLPFLQQMAKRLEVDKQVSFLGNRSRNDIYTCLQDYDLLVQPSRIEGFGLTVAEAMAAGVPVLIADIEGPMEIVDKGRCGDFFPQGDAKECARKIDEIITHYTERQTTALAGKEFVQDNFDISLSVENYLHFYNQ